jgi:hypothetical protein
VSTAEAAQYYTRKRVNGRWITGRFPKAGRTAERTSRRGRYAKAREVEEPAEVAPLPPLPPLRERQRLLETAAQPEADAALVTSGIGPLASLEEGFGAAGDRLARLRAALQARAEALAAKAVDLPPGLGLTSMGTRPALAPEEASAPGPVIAATSAQVETRVPVAQPAAPVQLSAPQAPPAAKGSTSIAAMTTGSASKTTSLEPKSVSYDFETGIRTTVYENSVVREAFDPAILKSLAGALRPAR